MPHRKNFKGQFDDEVVLAFFRKHWVTIFPRIIAIGFLTFLVGLGLWYAVLLGRQPGFLVALVVTAHMVATYLIHRQFLALFHYFLQTVMITNYRIVNVDRSVFFRDSKDSIDLANVQDIRKQQNGILENVLNYGTLTIVLSGTHASVNISMVPRPGYQFKKINKVKQTAWLRRRGVVPAEEVVRAAEAAREQGGQHEQDEGPIREIRSAPEIHLPPNAMKTEEEYVELLERM
jgi:hypothetical protein